MGHVPTQRNKGVSLTHTRKGSGLGRLSREEIISEHMLLLSYKQNFFASGGKTAGKNRKIFVENFHEGFVGFAEWIKFNKAKHLVHSCDEQKIATGVKLQSSHDSLTMSQAKEVKVYLDGFSKHGRDSGDANGGLRKLSVRSLEQLVSRGQEGVWGKVRNVKKPKRLTYLLLHHQSGPKIDCSGVLWRVAL